MITAKTWPMRQCRCNALFMLSQFREKHSVFSIEKFQFFVQARNTIMLPTTPYYPFLFPLSVKCRLREVENKRKFQPFSSKNWSRRLREGVRSQRVSDIVIWLETFGILIKRSLRRGGRNRRFDCSYLTIIRVNNSSHNELAIVYLNKSMDIAISRPHSYLLLLVFTAVCVFFFLFTCFFSHLSMNLWAEFLPSKRRGVSLNALSVNCQILLFKF